MKFNYPKAYSQYGSSMGRREYHAGQPFGKLRLQHVPLNRGGYDPGGAYWGIGTPLYRYEDSGDDENDGQVSGYVRAYSRDHAKSQITSMYPTARFYR